MIELKLAKLVDAIQTQEGWMIAGSRPNRNNNPGNLKFGPRARRFGAIDRDDEGHAIFPTYQQGRAALEDLIRSKQGQSLAEIGKSYAEDPAWAKAVAKLAGVELHEPLKFLTSQDPPWLDEALSQVGVLEGPGLADNPVVLAYYRDAGFPEIRHDQTPWCAAFVGAMLARSGVQPSGSLLARSYLEWGVALRYPIRGAITVLTRGKGMGHVFFWVAPGLGVGGNQSDRVSVARYDPSRVLGYRWPAEVKVPPPAVKDRNYAMPGSREREEFEEWFDPWEKNDA